MANATFHAADAFDLLPAIFRACVDHDAVIYSLALPFPANGHAYATDGRIVVRCPVDEETAVQLEAFREGCGRVPDVTTLWAHHSAIAYSAEPAAIPADIPEPYEVCPECLGFGLAKGYADEFYGYECPECEGERIVKTWDRVQIGPHFWLSSHFCGLFRGFGATLHLPVGPRPDRGNSARFAVKGGDVARGGDPIAEGFVMGMTAPDEVGEDTL